MASGPETGKENVVVFEYTPEADESAPGNEPKTAAEPAERASGRPGFAKQSSWTAVKAASTRFVAAGSRTGIGHHHEAPDKRLARLQSEVADLLAYAQAQDGKDPTASGNAATDLGDSPAAVALELKILEQRLAGLAPDCEASKDERSAAQQAKLNIVGSHLERLAAHGQSAAAATGAGDTGVVTYQVSYAPVARAAADAADFAALDGELAAIEKQLGHFDRAAPFEDLQTAVMQLQSRLAGLDAGRLEAIRAGVRSATADVDAVLHKKRELEAAAANPDLDRKAAELYDFCHRWSTLAPLLPAISERLRTLQSLYQESATFTERLAALEKQQDDLAKLLGATDGAVRELGQTLKESVEAMQESMKLQEARIINAVRA